MPKMRLVSLEEFIEIFDSDEAELTADDTSTGVNPKWQFKKEYYKSTYISISWYENYGKAGGRLRFRMDLSPVAGNRYWVDDGD